MTQMEVTTIESEQAFWDERFRYFQAQGLDAESAGDRSDKALEVRRGHPLIKPEELAELKADVRRLREMRSEVLENLYTAVGARDAAQSEAFKATRQLEAVTARRDWLETESASLRSALERRAERDRTVAHPTEKLKAAVTIWDIYQALHQSKSLWVAVRQLLAKWGVDVTALEGSEFWSDVDGIVAPHQIDPEDSDTRRRLRKYLETGLYVKAYTPSEIEIELDNTRLPPAPWVRDERR